MADFGISMFAIDSAIHPATLALAAEERGFESLFLPEHTHIPVSRRSPWPGGSELPKDYWHTNDLFIGLAMAAAVTQRLKLGTGICLVTEHDPILLAKQVATLDSLSGGRVILGVGAGWNAEEMEKPRGCLRRPMEDPARACLGHPPDLDARRCRIPWEVRGFRSNLGVPQAKANGRSADLAGC